MKTAVELFWKEIQDILPSSVDTETGIKLLRAFEKYKEMEEGQMIDFACDVHDLNYCKDKSFRNAAEQCYNETFKQQAKEELKYKYPVGDFLSGFSEDPNNPCGYELECQRMVSRGVQYLDDHKELCDVVDIGGVKTSDQRIKPMIHFMCLNESGHSGAMIDKTVRVSFVAKKMGWKTYIQKITEFQQQEQ